MAEPFWFGPFYVRSLTRLTKDEPYSRWASLLVVYMAYFHFPLVFGLNFMLPYDMPSLLFFCGCHLLRLSRRMALFYLFFVLRCFQSRDYLYGHAFWGDLALAGGQTG